MRRAQLKPPLVGVIVFFGLWSIICVVVGDYRRFLPWPWEVMWHLGNQLLKPDIWLDIALTSARTVSAFVIAATFGVPLGVTVGLKPNIYSALRIPIDFLRSIPIPALSPVAMLFLGVGDAAKIASVAIGCGLIVLVASAGAVRNLPELHHYVARMLGLSQRETFIRITLPAALPEIASGLRVAVSIALILVIVLEMFIGATGGLGLRLYNDQQLFRVRDMYATLFVVGSLGYLATTGLAILQDKFIHWSGK